MVAFGILRIAQYIKISQWRPTIIAVLIPLKILGCNHFIILLNRESRHNEGEKKE